MISAVSLTEFDQELYDKCRHEEGREEGAQEKALETANNLLKMKLGSPDQIAKATGLPLEKVLELESQIEEEQTQN